MFIGKHFSHVILFVFTNQLRSFLTFFSLYVVENNEVPEHGNFVHLSRSMHIFAFFCFVPNHQDDQNQTVTKKKNVFTNSPHMLIVFSTPLKAY